jgi:hypothetical protein
VKKLPKSRSLYAGQVERSKQIKIDLSTFNLHPAIFKLIRCVVVCLMLALLAACEFSPLNPTNPPTPSPSSTTTPQPSATATLPPTQTLTPSPTSPPSTATATQLSGPLPLCQSESAPATNGWVICHSPRYGFELSYPAESSLGEVREDYARIDLPIAPGTNLAEKYLEITASPGVKTCTSPLAQGFEPAAVPTQPVSLQSQEFFRQEGREGAAGNHYQWVAYSITQGDVCLSLSFMLHSTNPENYATPPAEFDSQQESAIFDQIMATFRWVK